MQTVTKGFSSPFRLAYVCDCRITAFGEITCTECCTQCDDCEGSGEDREPRTVLRAWFGGKDIIHMVMPLDCVSCDGWGYRREDQI